MADAEASGTGRAGSRAKTAAARKDARGGEEEEGEEEEQVEEVSPSHAYVEGSECAMPYCLDLAASLLVMLGEL